jgi:spermidine synthase
MSEPLAVESDVLDGNVGSAIRLAAYSFLILFFELAFIRYLPANVKVFSFYINFVLIATFVGMGAGLLAVRHVGWLRWAFPALALALLGLARLFSNVMIAAPDDPDEYLWGVFLDTAPAVQRIGMLPAVGILFAVCAMTFVPLGAMLGDEFRRFKPLVAYSMDIAGSLAGILAFGMASYLGLPTWSWFVLGFGVLTGASLGNLRYTGYAVGAAALAALSLLAAKRPHETWSPYYRIEWQRTNEVAYTINVNGSMHLTAVDVSEAASGVEPKVMGARAAYLAPYEYIDRVDTVLVLGAGAGNDVALLLELGAKHVDAVEIDPRIASFGSDLHFQRPFDDSKVQVHVTDARAFLKTTPRRYDLVVFGTLDSQTLLSGMSSVRLDNYVYTVEAIRAARETLKPDGRLIMYHMSARSTISAKIFQMLSETFEQPRNTCGVRMETETGRRRSRAASSGRRTRAPCWKTLSSPRTTGPISIWRAVRYRSITSKAWLWCWCSRPC